MSFQHTKYSTDSSTVTFHACPSPSLLPQPPSAQELLTDTLTVQKSLCTSCPPLQLQGHLPDSHHFATQFEPQYHPLPSQSKSHHQVLPKKQAALKPCPTSTQLTARHQIPQVLFPPLSPPIPRTVSFLALTHSLASASPKIHSLLL